MNTDMKKYSTLLRISALLALLAALPARGQLGVRDNGHVFLGDSISHYNYNATVNGYAGLRWTQDGDYGVSIRPGYTAGAEDYGVEGTDYPALLSAIDIILRNRKTGVNNTLEAKDILYFEYDWYEPHGNGGVAMTQGLEQILSLLPAGLLRQGGTDSLAAQDAESAWRGIRYTAGDGREYVSTKALVTLLVAACRQLDGQERELEADIAALEQDMGMEAAQSKALVSGNATAEDRTGARIDGNSPNPFTRTTTLRMSIPDGTARAVLRITQSSGQAVQETVIDARGEVAHAIDGGNWARGVYLATLIADGSVVGTVKLTKK